MNQNNANCHFVEESGQQHNAFLYEEETFFVRKGDKVFGPYCRRHAEEAAKEEGGEVVKSSDLSAAGIL